MSSPEAPLLRRANALKHLDFEPELTPPQREAIKAIRTQRDRGEPYINLYGPADAGKTFLCWALQADGWGYYQALPDSVSEPAVIYDHAAPDQRATRRLRNNFDMTGAEVVLYVTRSQASEVFPRIKLAQSDAHYRQVAATWERLEFDDAAEAVFDIAPTSTSTTSTTADTEHDHNHDE
jgi:hypothetical protein